MTFAIEKVSASIFNCFICLQVTRKRPHLVMKLLVSPNTLSEMVCILADQLYSCVTAILK